MQDILEQRDIMLYLYLEQTVMEHQLQKEQKKNTSLQRKLLNIMTKEIEKHYQNLIFHMIYIQIQIRTFIEKKLWKCLKKSMIMDIFMKKLNHNHIAKIVKNSYLIERFKLHVQNVELKQKLNNVMDVNMYQLLMI